MASPRSFRLPDEMLALLAKRAKALDRSVSWLIRHILTEWLRKQGKK